MKIDRRCQIAARSRLWPLVGLLILEPLGCNTASPSDQMPLPDLATSANQDLSATPQLSAITISPSSLSFGQGYKQQLAAKGTYSDGSSGDLSSMVTWGTGNAAVATITAGGVALGVAPGSASVTADLGDDRAPHLYPLPS